MITLAIFIPMTILAGITETADGLIARLIHKHKMRARRKRKKVFA
jgi:hypothetical protein